MRKILVSVLVIGTLFGSGTAYGQKATEFYIPVGKSPGLSGKYTAIGIIQSVDFDEHTMTIVGRSRTWTAKITDDTKIWLDRSLLRMTNKKGTPADCRPGVRVEVKYEGRGEPKSDHCEWVKVQLARINAEPRRPARAPSRRRR